MTFASPAKMIEAHELMFGEAGRTCADLVLRWAATLFEEPIDALAITVVLAPVEIGPYNKHRGFHSGNGQSALILANRHHVNYDGTFKLIDLQQFEDFIVHELTHARQHQLMNQNGWRFGSRGAHRDRGWFGAITEACPKYLGFDLPSALWPSGPRTRNGTLTEKEMTHWPASLRALKTANNPRLNCT
jgi:hypothetical protein